MTVRHRKWFNPLQDEEVLWYSHPSFIKYSPRLLLGILVAALGIIIPVYTYFFMDLPIIVSHASLLLLPLGLAYFIWEMIVYKKTYYVITNRRVIMKRGVIGRDTSSKPHREIVRVDVRVSSLDAVLSKLTSEDIGNMVVRTSDDSGEEFLMGQIPEVGLAESFMERYSGSDLSTEPSPHGSSTHPEPHTSKHSRTDSQSVSEHPTNSDEGNHSQQSPPKSQSIPKQDEENDTNPLQNTDDSEQLDDLDEFEPSEYA